MEKVKIPVRSCAVLVAGLLLTGVPVLAQDESDLRAEMEALRKGQESIQQQMELQKQINELKQGQADIKKQLDELKTLIQARPAAAPSRPAGPNVEGTVFDLGANPIKGEKTAKLTLVEWTDYQ
jgi:uncharacterized protein YlxW (UPF0749 family)